MDEFENFKNGYIVGYKKAIDTACEILSALEITQSGLFGEQTYPISAKTVQKFRKLLTEPINKLENELNR